MAKPDKIDWRVQRGALMVLGLSLAVSGAMLGGSYYFSAIMDQELRQAQREFNSISARYLALDSDERIIREQYPLFVELYHQGIIGHELRLSWIEVLNQASHDIGLPGLTYQISSQAPYAPDFSVARGGYDIYASTMELHLEMAHEGDLQALFARLDRDALGLYSVSACSFVRVGSPDTPLDPANPRIFADCELIWFNINRASLQNLSL